MVHIPVRENGVKGTLVAPDMAGSYPGVLRIGGAEGGISVGDAEVIASEGYAVFAIAYSGMEGLPTDLEEVTLKYFGKAIAWMQSRRISIPQGSLLLVSQEGARSLSCCRQSTMTLMP